jgi:hypothetical protein
MRFNWGIESNEQSTDVLSSAIALRMYKNVRFNKVSWREEPL